MHLSQGSSQNGKILGEQKDLLPPYLSGAADNPVAQELLLPQTEIGGSDGDVGLLLDEGALVQENVQAFPGGQLALLVLGIDPLLPAPGQHPGSIIVISLQRISVTHGIPPVLGFVMRSDYRMPSAGLSNQSLNFN